MENPISINEFVEQIGLPASKRERVIEWWSENRERILIHFFPFRTSKPILGVFLGTDEIAINSRIPVPPHIKLFLALHESRHCDQHLDGILMELYYDPVVNDDFETFSRGYRELEEDANIFAINAMREMGFVREMDMEENRLRSNELAGQMVFNMMKQDIAQLNPIDFIDLLKKQIL